MGRWRSADENCSGHFVPRGGRRRLPNYVQGTGGQPATSGPQTIERQGVARTYAWTQKAEMPTPRTEVTASVLHGKVYVIGGFDGSARTLATVEVYDPATDSWHSGPDLPEARHHAAAVTLEDTFYVIGGFAGPGFEPSLPLYPHLAMASPPRR